MEKLIYTGLLLLGKKLEKPGITWKRNVNKEKDQAWKTWKFIKNYKKQEKMQISIKTCKFEMK